MITLTDTELQALSLSLKVASVATLCALPLAVGLAYLLANKEFPLKVWLDGLIHLPLVVPPVVTGYALLLLIPPGGTAARILSTVGISVNFSWAGAAIASMIMALPLMVRAIRQAFEAQDPMLRAIGINLGQPRWRVLFRISLPLALPGILAGTALGFARAIGEFGATITFVSNIPGRTQTLPLAIYNATQTIGGESAALRLVLLALVPAIASLVISEILTRRARLKRGLKRAGGPL